jgi:hypothetical protein
MSVKQMVAKVKLHNLKRTVEPAELMFPQSVQSPKSLLVCLPRGLKELTAVKPFLPMITDLYKNSNVCLLTPPGVNVANMFPRKGFEILSPATDQLTWAGLAKRSFLKRLEEYHFDMVIDLNIESTPFMSSILLSQPEAVRVGRGNFLGDPYYNLEIKTRYLRDQRAIYRSLFDTLKSIKTGRPTRLPGGDNQLSLEEPCT